MRLLTDLETRVDRVQSGLHDRSEEKEAQAIDQHVAEYRAHLPGCTPRWLSQTIKHVETIIDSCGFARLADIESADVEQFLDDLSTDRRNAAGEIVRGVNAKTRNTYLASMRSFVRWCAERHHIRSIDRLDTVMRHDEESDRRHERRALDPPDAVKLSKAALRRPVERAKFFISMNGRKMTDSDRQRIGVLHALIWKIMLCTGIRKNELATLT